MLRILRSAGQGARLATTHRPLAAAGQLPRDVSLAAPPHRAFANDSDTSFASSEQGGGAPGPQRVVVFGGNGYVGSHICQAALAAGLDVTSVSRSGRPSFPTGLWGDQVTWVAGDALQPESYKGVLDGAAGVICSIGGFGSNEMMLKVNGETNIQALEAAAAAGVPRAAFISAHDYKLPEFVMAGYFRGKRNAEQALRDMFPDSGVILRPGFIHGTRMVGSTALPLSYIGAPLEKLLKMLPSKTLAAVPLAGAAAVPPVSVEKVAHIAVTAVSDLSVPGGILDPWQLQDFVH